MKKYILLNIILMFIYLPMHSQSYLELVDKSIDCTDSGDYESAESVLKEAMRKDPANSGNILLLSNLGTIQRALNKPQEALLSYNLAITKYPTGVTLLMNRAALYCEMDSLNLALKDYNAVLSLNPNNISALLQRGLLYISKKDLLSAESDFNQVVSLQPKNIQAKSNLAFILKSKKDWEGAEKKYTDLIFENKQISDLYVNRAECYLHQKKLGKASEDLRKAEELKYDDPFLYILKGQLNLQQFDKFVAKQNFNKALELGADKEVIDQYLILCK